MHRAIACAVLLVLAASLSACAEENHGGTSSSKAGVGAEAPTFSLASADAGTVSLEDYIGRKLVLLYFSMGPG